MSIAYPIHPDNQHHTGVFLISWFAFLQLLQIFDEITCGRSLCDANGHLHLSGFKTMAFRLTYPAGPSVAYTAIASPAIARQLSFVSSVKAVAAAFASGLRNLPGSSRRGLEVNFHQDQPENEDSSPVRKHQTFQRKRHGQTQFVFSIV